jgi:hypothetical protein
MANYFSKYQGRGGPAIAPGIVQMMGSIGDEYAKGITAISKGYSDRRKAQEEQEKTEAANDLWTQIMQGPKSIEDPEAYGEAVLKETEDQKLAIEEARISEREVDSVAEETTSMKNRLDNKSYLGPKGYLQAGHPLSQVRKITKEFNKYQPKLEAQQEELAVYADDIALSKAAIEDILADLRKGGTGTSMKRSIMGSRLPTDEEATILKKAKESIRASTNATNDIKRRPSYENLSKYVTKLDSLRSLENEMPGSTIGFNKIKRDPENELVLDETEAGRIVDERVRVFSKQRDDGVFKGGQAAEKLLGYNPRYTPEALRGAGVKQEDLERFLTLPQDRLSAKETAAKNRYRGTQKRLEELREKPTLDPADYMRNQTQEELVSEVVGKVDSGKLRSTVLPNLAAWMEKTKAPEARLVNMGGQSFIMSDPGTTAIKAVSSGPSFSESLSMKKFEVDMERAASAGETNAREYYDKQLASIKASIHEFEIAKGQNTWTGSDLRPWDAELDEKRLADLYRTKKDMTELYKQQNEKFRPTGGVRKPVKI